MSGSPTVTFIALVQDGIRTHGLQWAVTYYSKRMPRWEARWFIMQAYLTMGA